MVVALCRRPGAPGAALRAPGVALRAVSGLAAALLLAAPPVQAVAGGVPVKEREYPFVAALVRRTGVCTAIVLTEHWLLTAAHCYTTRSHSETNPFFTDVYAGLVDVSGGAARGCGPGCQHRQSFVAHLHPHFRAGVGRSLYDDGRHNDLALVHVSKAFWLDTDWVRSAVRASAPTKVCSCKLVGFGMGGVGPFAWKPGRLQRAGPVPFLPAKLCPPPRTGAATTIALPGATLCSDSKYGVAPCLGDAGAPVICDGFVTGMALGVYESHWEYPDHAFYCGLFKSCSLFGLYASLEPYGPWIESVVFRAPGVVRPLYDNDSLVDDPAAAGGRPLPAPTAATARAATPAGPRPAPPGTLGVGDPGGAATRPTRPAPRTEASSTEALSTEAPSTEAPRTEATRTEATPQTA